MYRMGLAALLVLISGAADARPAWEIADRWWCRTSIAAACEVSKPCDKYPVETLREINFAQGTVSILGLDPPHDHVSPLPIAARAFDDYVDYPDATYLHVDKWIVMAIFENPSATPTEEPDFSFQLLAASAGGRPSMSFGKCQPVGA